MLTCVSEVISDGLRYIVVDDTCSSGMALVSLDVATALAQNPLAIPLEAAGPMLWATLALFITAFALKQMRKALD